MTAGERPLVSINLVVWNGVNHLPACVQSLEKQTWKRFSILVVDNGSLDGSVDWLRVHAPQAYLLQNNRNLGFAHGHNQAIRLSSAPYILCLNQDIVLSPEWLAKAIAVMEAHPTVGAYGSLIERFAYDDQSLTGVVSSGIIDTAGLAMSRSRHAYDRYSGRPVADVQIESGPVFGVSAACALYRRSALESVRFQDEYFDDDFFSYKEDVDLAWRLQRAGWTAWFDANNQAFHHRSVRGDAATQSLRIAQNHRRRTALNTMLSYRNHILMLMKNETSQSFWPDAFPIAWYEFRKTVFLMFTRPRSLRAWSDIIRLRGRMKKKAALIRHQAKCSARDVRQMFLSSHP